MSQAQRNFPASPAEEFDNAETQGALWETEIDGWVRIDEEGRTDFIKYCDLKVSSLIKYQTDC